MLPSWVISAHTFAYDGLLLDTETIVADGITNVLDRSHDSLGRAIATALSAVSGTNYYVGYGYDSQGRFSSVSSSVASANSAVNYSYLPNSDLISTVAGVGDPDLSASRSYEDHRNLLTQIQNNAGTTTVSRFDYQNDAIGRRAQFFLAFIFRLHYRSVSA